MFPVDLLRPIFQSVWAVCASDTTISTLVPLPISASPYCKALISKLLFRQILDYADSPSISIGELVTTVVSYFDMSTSHKNISPDASISFLLLYIVSNRIISHIIAPNGTIVSNGIASNDNIVSYNIVENPNLLLWKYISNSCPLVIPIYMLMYSVGSFHSFPYFSYSYHRFDLSYFVKNSTPYNTSSTNRILYTFLSHTLFILKLSYIWLHSTIPFLPSSNSYHYHPPINFHHVI